MFSRCRTVQLLFWVFIGAFAAPLYSQDAYDKTVPIRGAMPFADLLVSGVDTIDPVSRKLSMSIPLASVPSGRGGFGFDVSLEYDSHLYWDSPTQGLCQHPYPDPYTGLWANPVVVHLINGRSGWSYNFKNYKLWEEFKDAKNLLYPEDCADDGQTKFRMRIVLPDGSDHVLYLKDNYANDGFIWIGPDGRGKECRNILTHYGRLTYFTNDGSFLKLEIDADGTNWTQKEWTLYYPDGRRVVGKADQATDLYDANGNRIQIRNEMYGSIRYTRLIAKDGSTDDPARQVVIEYGVEASGGMVRDRVSTPGPNSQPWVGANECPPACASPGNLNWSIDWAPIQVQKVYGKIEGDDLCASGEGFGIDDKGVKSIQMPLAAHVPLGGPPPAHNAYQFSYSGIEELGSGEVNYIRTPAGAEYFYKYNNEGWPGITVDALLHHNGISEKVIAYDDGNSTNDNPDSRSSINPDSLKWSYATDLYSQTSITSPDGGVSTYHFGGNFPSAWSSDSYVKRITESDGTVRERVWAANSAVCENNYCSSHVQNPYVQRETVTTPAGGGQPAATAATEFKYDKNGNLTSKKEFHWNQGDVIRETTFDYYVTTGDASTFTPNAAEGYWQPHNPQHWSGPWQPRRLNALRRKSVKEGYYGSTVAATEFDYDDDDPYIKGNVRAEKRWDSKKLSYAPGLGGLNSSNSQVLTRTYDQWGNLTDVYEPEVRTHTTYDSTGNVVVRVDQGSGSAQRSFQYNWTATRTSLTSKLDLNNNTAVSYVYDSAGRRINTLESYAGTNLRKTQTIYDDASRKIAVKSDLRTFGDEKLQAVSHYDSLGRVTLVQKSDGAPIGSASDGIKVATNYYYASNGRRVVTSSPFRTTADPTLQWTCTQYDQRGRVAAVAMFKGSVAPTDCASATNRTGITQSVYGGDSTTITDPAGKVRREYRDAAGRIRAVTEDPSGSNNGTTVYTYDPLDNLTAVAMYVTYPVAFSQPVYRNFNYSSLGRLLTATNPESGTIQYEYYDDGNLKQRTDARGVWTRSEYDALHRIWRKTHSDTTPTVTYAYSLTAPSVGQLESVQSDVATTAYGYDALGRVVTSGHDVSGYPDRLFFDYDWYLNGALKQMIYPSGRAVDYEVDDAGRTTNVHGSATVYADLTAPGITQQFTADGRVAQMRLGNGLWETRDYRNPGEPTYYRLGSVLGAGNIVELGYNFSATANNGNVESQTITRPGHTTWTQMFTYDGVNRLLTANEVGGFSRTYGYDTPGNRWVASSSGLAYADPLEPTAWSNFDYSGSNRLAGIQYDQAGNQRVYGAHTLGYDAESRNTTTSSTSSGNGTFYYDGDGRRVKKVWTPPGGATATTYYFYNALGQLAAEYSSETPTTTGTTYMFTDMLGSVRAITSQTGAVTECYDYLPFGRMLTASDNGRSSVGCYPASPSQPSSSASQKFTGKERDQETGLDYFGARYLSSAQGRFTSPDPIGVIGQKVLDPQQWHMYSYTRNNPLRFLDPTGMYVTSCQESDVSKCDEDTQAFEAARQRDLKSKDRNVRKAAEAYGEYGNEGVTVLFEKKDAGVGGTVTFDLDSAGKATGTVTVNFTPGQMAEGRTGNHGDTVMDAMVAHEGSHVRDYLDLVESGYKDNKNIGHLETEQKAYSIQNRVIELEMGRTNPDWQSKRAIESYLKQHPTLYPNLSAPILIPRAVPDKAK